jgi:hypothetical protein
VSGKTCNFAHLPSSCFYLLKVTGGALTDDDGDVSVARNDDCYAADCWTGKRPSATLQELQEGAAPEESPSWQTHSISHAVATHCPSLHSPEQP